MKRQRWKRKMAVLLALVLGIQMSFVIQVPFGQAYAYTERQATVNASSLNVRSGPGTSYSRVTSVSKGASVTVINEVNGSDGKQWYQIRTGSGTGYVLGSYLRFPVAYNKDSNFESYLTSQGFPESYKPALRQLHAQYPNWVFEAHRTGLDWNTVIQNESIIPRSLIHKNSISSHKSTADGAYNWENGTWTGFDGSSWVAASEEILRYYMDPRNFLDDVYIFQFMNHGYDPSTQTREGLQALLRGTFLDGSTTGGGTWNGSTGNSGGGSSYGPGGSSSGSSSGVVVSPGASGSSSGPGVSGGGGNASPSGDQNVRLQSPSASVSRHDAPRVASSVRVGVKPGQAGSGNPSSGSGVQGGTSPSPGSGVQGGTSPSPGNGMQGGTSPSPGSGVQGGSSPSPGGSSQGNVSSSPVVAPGGGASLGGAVSPGGSLPGEADGGTVSYVDVIMKAAQVSGVNPYVLASMIIQEQGSDGRGNSIKGNHASYPGYYNYFNVGAYAADGMGAVERGLWYASQSGSYGRPWNTPEKAIIGGAQFYGENYVRAGQDTFYLKKYNVQGSNLYKHQYMTNVDGAASEGSIFAESYSDKLKSLPLRFKIPVYNGMPDTPCAKPTGDGSPNNKLGNLGVEGFSLTPTFNRDTYSYNLIVNNSVGTVSVYANALDSTAVVSGAGNYQISSGANDIRVRVRAQNGNEREYVIHVVRQGGGAAYNGGNGSPAGGGSPGGNSGQAGMVTGPGTGNGPGSGGGSLGGAPTPGGSNVIIISP